MLASALPLPYSASPSLRAGCEIYRARPRFWASSALSTPGIRFSSLQSPSYKPHPRHGLFSIFFSVRHYPELILRWSPPSFPQSVPPVPLLHFLCEPVRKNGTARKRCPGRSSVVFPALAAQDIRQEPPLHAAAVPRRSSPCRLPPARSPGSRSYLLARELQQRQRHL